MNDMSPTPKASAPDGPLEEIRIKLGLSGFVVWRNYDDTFRRGMLNRPWAFTTAEEALAHAGRLLGVAERHPEDDLQGRLPYSDYLQQQE
jgi:hypothetical protein